MGATGRQQMQNNAMSLLDFQPKGLKNNTFNCRVRNSFPVYKMTECSGTVDWPAVSGTGRSWGASVILTRGQCGGSLQVQVLSLLAYSLQTQNIVNTQYSEYTTEWTHSTVNTQHSEHTTVNNNTVNAQSSSCTQWTYNSVNLQHSEHKTLWSYNSEHTIRWTLNMWVNTQHSEHYVSITCGQQTQHSSEAAWWKHNMNIEYIAIPKSSVLLLLLHMRLSI